MRGLGSFKLVRSTLLVFGWVSISNPLANLTLIAGDLRPALREAQRSEATRNAEVGAGPLPRTARSLGVAARALCGK